MYQSLAPETFPKLFHFFFFSALWVRVIMYLYLRSAISCHRVSPGNTRLEPKCYGRECKARIITSTTSSNININSIPFIRRRRSSIININIPLTRGRGRCSSSSSRRLPRRIVPGAAVVAVWEKTPAMVGLRSLKTRFHSAASKNSLLP